MVDRRLTKQRKKILEFVVENRIHPTAEQVYNEIKKEIPDITLATVYRNLHILVEEGKLLRLDVNHEYHFDGFVEAHQHLVCIKCERIYDVGNDKIFKSVLKKINHPKFKINNLLIQGKGECVSCLET